MSVKPVIYKDTGKIFEGNDPSTLPAHQIVGRNNSIYEAREVSPRVNLHIDQDEWLSANTRNNAIGDIGNSSMGVQAAISTLTFIIQQMVRQKFMDVPIADFLPLTVGRGAFSQELLFPVSFYTGNDFEAGNMNQGTSSAQASMSDAAISTIKTPIVNWQNGIQFNTFELNQAIRALNFDLIAEKFNSRAKIWQLGLQKTAFIGSSINPAQASGLLTHPAATLNTTLITGKINTMTFAQIDAFVATLFGSYFGNTDNTALPDTFVIPSSDFLGLGSQMPGTNGSFPIPKLVYLENAFKMFVPNFKILHNPYGDVARNGLAKQIYALYRNDQDSIEMNVPIDLTATAPVTTDGFNFVSRAIGQYTGVTLKRKLELTLFTYAA